MSAPEPANHVLVSIDAGICTICFNRPRKKNALTVAMYRDIVAGMALARGRDDVRVILFHGSEGVFTGGNDLADFAAAGQMSTDSPVAQFIQHLVECDKPVLAAVQGPAVGLGVTMLLHCDLVFAGEHARFNMPFVDLGLCPEAGSSLLLPRMMGHQRAAELLMLGGPFSAATAHEYGIVNQVLADEAVLERARAAAETLAKKPPRAMRTCKRLLRAPYREALERTLTAEYAAFNEGLGSPEAAEAFSAFLEKRAPDFSRFS